MKRITDNPNLTYTTTKIVIINNYRMRFLVLALLFVCTKSAVIDQSPKCVNIRNKSHEIEVLRQGFPVPYELAIDHATNTLFYSYNVEWPKHFELIYMDLKTNDYGNVSEISRGFATAIDRDSNTVYMGGDDGIYIFDYDTKTATNINKTQFGIWQMFYKDGLYFIAYPEQQAYVYKDDEVTKLPQFNETVTELVIKNDGSILYANDTGLFAYDESTETDKQLGDHIINAFSSDIEGNIYFSTPSGLYYINDENNEIEELISLPKVNGIAIEANGNIIYSDADSIIRLKPTARACSDISTE